jgi:Tol biopolymer transport system component/tRNA A-37 threonylcarbamoyl transferase component Bud32
MIEVPARLATALADRYRIERELGQGGMATVYLAHDVRHDRKVAIKVLLPELAAVIGAERFLSEIKTTANLQHPHILPLFDSGSAEGQLFYVMPYVEGETLRGRLQRETQLPVADAVRLASEVAAALDYAHKHGVVHRDIKPENILVQHGSALVADFGIALAVQQAGASRMTQTGMSLGTPQYMSPEQAMGDKQIDARSDIYALGAVTYEMLIGEPPFTGPSAQAIVAKVMTESPKELTAQRKSIPTGVSAAVAQALEKLPADRFNSAAEFAAALANPNATSIRTNVQHAQLKRRGWIAVAATGAAALVAGYLIGHRGGAVLNPAADQVVRATITLGDSARVRAVGNIRLAISPRGGRIVYVGSEQPVPSLWMRDFDQPDAHPIPDTKGGFGPFFSPDGQSIGFFAPSNGHASLKTIRLSGGVARVLVQDSVAEFGGADWADDNQIYYTDASRAISRVAASGGMPTRIATTDSAIGAKEYDFPDVLPGSRYALAMLWKGSISANGIGVLDLRNGKMTELTTGSYARYVAPGFIAIGVSDGRILVAPFDLANGRLAGTPVPVLANVQPETANGTIQFAVDELGTIVYERMSGGGDGLVWVDFSGHYEAVDSSWKGIFPQLSLSPDGTQIAVGRAESGENQVWVKNLITGTATRLAIDVKDPDRPVWTPDGRGVAYLGTRDNHRSPWLQRPDGSDAPRGAISGSLSADEISFQTSGPYTVVRSEGVGTGSRKLYVVEAGKDTVPRMILPSKFDQYGATLSPDGRWLALVSEESGAPQVYVRPFPNVDSARFTISVTGGTEPLWRRDGKELYFRDQRGAILAVAVTTGASFGHSPPRKLFDGGGFTAEPYHRAYDIHPDGKRFLMIKSGGNDASELSVIFNWRKELERIKGGTP